MVPRDLDVCCIASVEEAPGSAEWRERKKNGVRAAKNNATSKTSSGYSAFHKYAESRKKKIVYLITNQDPIRGDMT
jgi:hypothetical protein